MKEQYKLSRPITDLCENYLVKAFSVALINSLWRPVYIIDSSDETSLYTIPTQHLSFFSLFTYVLCQFNTKYCR